MLTSIHYNIFHGHKTSVQILSWLPTPCHARDSAECMSSALAMNISLPMTARDIVKAICKDLLLAIMFRVYTMDSGQCQYQRE